MVITEPDPESLLNFFPGIWSDQREAFSLDNLSSTPPCIALAIQPHSEKGDVGYGPFYSEPFRTDYQTGTVIYWEIVFPERVGGNNDNWLFLTATNRANLGVEAYVSYYSQNEPEFVIFDWAWPDPPTRWRTVRPLRELGKYIREHTINGNYVRSLPYLNFTYQISPSHWRNQVWLFCVAESRWDLIYQFDYPATLEAQHGLNKWGPMVESFRTSAYAGTALMGAFNTQLASRRSDGSWDAFKKLEPKEADSRNDGFGFIKVHDEPQHTWLVCSRSLGPRLWRWMASSPTPRPVDA